MSKITALVEQHLMQYPTMYKTRLDVLNRMFSRGQSTFYIDKNGDMYSTEEGSLYVAEQPKPRPEGDGYALESWMCDEAERRRRVADEEFVFQNVDLIAVSSIHDKLTCLREIAMPRRWEHSYGQECTIDELSKDTKDALMEVLFHYENEYNDTVFRDTDMEIQHLRTSRVWNLTHRATANYFDVALEMLRVITGKTRGERKDEREAFSKRLIAEMLLEQS